MGSEPVRNDASTRVTINEWCASSTWTRMGSKPVRECCKHTGASINECCAFEFFVYIGQLMDSIVFFLASSLGIQVVVLSDT